MQQTINWVNVDQVLCCHVSSLDHDLSTMINVGAAPNLFLMQDRPNPILKMIIPMSCSCLFQSFKARSYVENEDVVGADNGLALDRQQAIIWNMMA